MTEHPAEALSAYLDGDLDAAGRAAVEAHLDGCGECRAIVDDLRTLRARARSWAERDRLGRRARVGGRRRPDRRAGARRRPGAAVVPPALVGGDRGTGAWRRRWSRRVTAGVMWRSAPDAVVPDAGPEPVRAELEPGGIPEGAVTNVSFADAQFDAAVADLERVLREQRDSLNPRTVLVLERNLQIIDDAIREARAALDGDPANAMLNAHLARARQRKLDLLRRAALITEGDLMPMSRSLSIAACALLLAGGPRRRRPGRAGGPAGAGAGAPRRPRDRLAELRPDRGRHPRLAARALEPGRRGHGADLGPRRGAGPGDAQRPRAHRRPDRRQHRARPRPHRFGHARPGGHGRLRPDRAALDAGEPVGHLSRRQHRRRRRRGERRDGGRRHHPQGRHRSGDAALDRRRDPRRERHRQGAGDHGERLDLDDRRVGRRRRRDHQRRCGDRQFEDDQPGRSPR